MTTTTTMRRDSLQQKHEAALDYDAYLATDPAKAEAWRKVYAQIELTADQRALVEGFSRQVRMLCISGIWCGDCAQQGPLLQRIAEANPVIDLRWIDRDVDPDLRSAVRINAGDRVPMVLFMAEDYEPVSIMGDRTITRYRAIAARNLGPSCPVPGAPVPDEELRGTLQDWLDEVERVHLLLRLSGRLRERHSD